MIPKDKSGNPYFTIKEEGWGPAFDEGVPTVLVDLEINDNVPVLLDEGHPLWAIKDEVVKKYGRAMIDAINEGTVDMSKFKTGGFTKGGKL